MKINLLKTKIIKNLLFVFIILGFNVILAQKNYVIDSKSIFKIKGTSSLHDWEMISKTGTATAKLTADATKVTDFDILSVEIPAESIKSGKNGMDKNAYKALKTSDFKTIKFVLKNAAKINDTTWKLIGDFIIAGKTKSATFNSKINVTNSIISIQGSYPFKLTEYGINPPTALMGTVKTGDAVSIEFDVKLK